MRPGTIILVRCRLGVAPLSGWVRYQLTTLRGEFASLAPAGMARGPGAFPLAQPPESDGSAQPGFVEAVVLDGDPLETAPVRIIFPAGEIAVIEPGLIEYEQIVTFRRVGLGSSQGGV